LGLIDPLTALVVSLGLLVLMLVKRLRLGIALNITAIALAFLSVDVQNVPRALYSGLDPLTIDGQLALSITATSFGIVLLSQLYKDSGTMDLLNRSLESILRNPKTILTVAPAIIGLLPVAGGALMSAPIVDVEGDKLGLSKPKKVYVNLWFRHLIFLVYPLSPQFIIAIALAGIASVTLFSMTVPAVMFMAIIGYISSFRGVKAPLEGGRSSRRTLSSEGLTRALAPIAVSIAGAIALGLLSRELSRRGLDVLVAAVMGLVTLATTTKAAIKSLPNALRSPTIYDITLATFGAFLLKSVISASGLPEALKGLISNGNPSSLLLVAISTLCSFCLGSASGGLAVSLSIFKDVVSISPREVALTYMAACLGYTISPLHLCLLFTADYFKVDLKEVYKAMLPSFAASLATITALYTLV